MSVRLELCLGVPGGCHENPALHDDGYVHDLLYTSRSLIGRHLTHVRHCHHFALMGANIYPVLYAAIVVKRCKTFIESDSALRTTFHKMFRHLGTHDSARYREPITMVAGVPFYGIIARFCGIHQSERFCEVLTE